MILTSETRIELLDSITERLFTQLTKMTSNDAKYTLRLMIIGAYIHGNDLARKFTVSFPDDEMDIMVNPHKRNEIEFALGEAIRYDMGLINNKLITNWANYVSPKEHVSYVHNFLGPFNIGMQIHHACVLYDGNFIVPISMPQLIDDIRYSIESVYANE